MSLAFLVASASFLFVLLPAQQAQANPVWTTPAPVVVYPDALFSFGANFWGVTGQGTTEGNTAVPTRVGDTSNWTYIHAGKTGSFAINSAGELWGWGWNSSGQMGQGTIGGNFLVPTRIGDASNWTAVAAAERHVLAINEDGELWSWGLNAHGQTGQGTTLGYTLVPTRVGNASNWVAVAAGSADAASGYSLAVNSAGELFSWGNNYDILDTINGQLGLGDDIYYVTVPTRVGTASNWTAVAAHRHNSLALNSYGEIWAWGTNGTGITGLDTTTGHTYVPTRVGTASNWTAIGVGWSHALALNSAGELWSWGQNFNNQLGLGDLGIGVHRTTPTRVGTASNWTAISAGNAHSLAINSAGELWSWGNNDSGRTGQGTNAGTTNVPTRVGTYSNWAAISAGVGQSLAIRSILEPGEPEPLTITKTLVTPEGTTIPTDMSFDFSFAPRQVRVVDNPPRYSVAIAQVPTITNQTLYLDMTTIATASGTTSATGILDLIEMLETLTPLGSGQIYVWEVREVIGSSLTTSPSYVTYDTRGFQLRVHTDRYGELAAIEIFEIVEVEGQAPTLGDKVEGMGFANTLRTVTRVQDNNALFISKTTVGEFADLSTSFNFTLNLTGHALAPITFPVSAYIITEGVAVPTPVSITASPFNFTLTNGQRLSIPTLPVGTTFSVTEQAHAEFNKGVVVYVGGAEVFDGSADAGNSLSTGNRIIAQVGANSAAFTNTHNHTPPTGLVITTAPWIALALSAALLLAVLTSSKNRKRIEELPIMH